MDRAQGNGGHSAIRRDPRLLAAILALGLIGVASLLLMPLEQLVPGGGVPRTVLVIQPAILVAGAALLGWWAAPKAGLGAPILSALVRAQPVGASLRAAAPAIGLVSLAGAAVLLVYAAASAGVLVASPTADLPQPLAARMLYGGLSEEVIARWGLLSAVMLGLLRLLPRRAAFWTANGVAALLFALGHFGALFAVVPDPPAWLTGAVLLGNMVPGLLFGWLFMRHGLLAAMLGHAGTHLLAYAGLALSGFG